ncbi:MAG: type 1 glutamine amidotransferase [Burkholderiales bacterium]|nr:type 1 glutamine amidotransferase [Burkholderiales bacterium]
MITEEHQRNGGVGRAPPVAILKNSPLGNPGRIAQFFSERGIAFTLIDISAGDPVPDSPDGFAGLVVLGGPMSVNDPLPWVEAECALIRRAAPRIPVAGHCLGAQLMARAFGQPVTRNPVREFGWGELEVRDAALAREWLGEFATGPVPTLHWHGETFGLPTGARLMLSSRHCEHQAFVLDDRHLGLQCHFETAPDAVRGWAQTAAGAIARDVARGAPGSQPVAEILRELDMRTARIHRVLDALYARWVQGLRGT